MGYKINSDFKQFVIQQLFNPYGFTPQILQNLSHSNREVVINFILSQSNQAGLTVRRDDILNIISVN